MRHMRVGRRAVLLGGAATALAGAADPPPLSPMLAALYEKAKPEGEVTIWGAGSPNLEWIPAEFGKRFPGIKVTWLGDQQASARLITESLAGRSRVDVWSFSLGGTIEVQRRGLLRSPDWAALGVPEEGVLMDGQVGAWHNYVFAPVFLPSRLPQAQRPVHWDDMLAASWTDRMVATTFLLPRMTGYLAIAWGGDRAEKWLRTLINDRKTLITAAQVNDILASGERVLAPAESTGTAFQLSHAGVPADYQIMEIVPATQFVLGLLKRAPKPNAAKLLVAWLLSPDGKATNERVAGWPDIRANPDSPIWQRIAAAKAKIVFEDMSTMKERADYYRRFSDIVRGVG